MFDYMIVGAGFAGSVLAERLAAGSGKRVLIVDRRPHIGGNAYDHYNSDGLLVHRYGPHVFHTNSAEVFQCLSRFTAWRPYEHRVLASVDGQLVLPVPINTWTQLTAFTTSILVRTSLNCSSPGAPVVTATYGEDKRRCRSVKVGRELYEKVLSRLHEKTVGPGPFGVGRSGNGQGLPTRTTRDDRYFTDACRR
ncbi:MAG: NAD(P)-binding protein [Pyrinomonadaceae bacterium]